MTNKNPYEEDTVDIPDFVEDKSSSIDMSIFKMTDKELYDDESDQEEYDDELAPKKKGNKANILLIIMAVALVVLLGLSIFFAVSKIKADKQVEQLTNEVTTLNNKISTYESTINSLNTTITQKDDEIKKLKESGNNVNPGKDKDKKDDDSSSETTDDSGETLYVVVNAEGVVVRDEAKTSGSPVGSLGEGNTFYGISTIKDAEGNIWIEASDGYVCMKLADGTVLVKAK